MDAYFNPGQSILSDDFVEKNKTDVLLLLAKKGTCYTTEISRDLGLHYDSVNKILAILVKDKMIAKFIPDRWYPQPPIFTRLGELQAMSMDSHGKIARVSWWVITPEGVQWIIDNLNGKGHRIHGSILKYWDMGHPELKNK